MNPLTANPAIAVDHARRLNDERVRLAEQHRLARRPRRTEPRRTRRWLGPLTLVWRPRAVRRRAATC